MKEDIERILLFPYRCQQYHLAGSSRLVWGYWADSLPQFL